MGIFKQDINQAVCDNILSEGSVFWNEWLIPSVAVHAGTDKVNIYNYLSIQHFKTDFPISIQDNTLVCHSGYQSMCMWPDNLPNKYIPGLVGLNWPSARFMINCQDRDFIGEEFNSIACETLYISNVNTLNNWNIHTNSACCINNTNYIENCQFTTKKMLLCGRDLPQMKNCTATNPVHLIVTITREPSNPYLREFAAKINKEKRRSMNMTTLEKLKEILSDCKGEDIDVTPETTFEELDFDSLDKVDIVMQIEEAYDISLGENLQLSTVGELIAKIDEAVANK